MALDALVETTRILRDVREKHEHVAVAFSGGKDSRVLLDIASRTFPRITPFYMHTVPGMRHDDETLAIAKERYGLEVLRITHWAVFRWLKAGVFNFEPLAYEDLAQPTVYDVYGAVMDECGAGIVLTGAMRVDSLWRRRTLAASRDRTDVAHPLVGWQRADVYAYLRRHNIEIPQQDSATASGDDLTKPALLWLHDRYPDDFEKLERTWPFIRAEVFREKWFGGGRAR